MIRWMFALLVFATVCGAAEHKPPVLTTAAVIEVYEGDQFQGIVLIERGKPPLGKALPGGKVEYGETVEAAIRREMMEEVNLELGDLRQFHVYSDPERDFRHHSVEVTHLARSESLPVAGDDAAKAFVVPLDQIPWKEMAFDHAQILRDYMAYKGGDRSKAMCGPAVEMGRSTLIEAASVSEVIPLVQEETWLLVDLDNTLFQGKQALGHANWCYDEVQQRMERGMTREEAIRDFYPEWIRVQSVCQVQPVEPQMVAEILALQRRGVVVMGVTHRQPSVAQATVRQIESLGLDFRATAPAVGSFTVPADTPALYTQGVLFVGDFNSKGEVFPTFLSMIQQKPARIAFLDDKRKNVEELEAPLMKRGIDYLGVHYTAIDRAPRVYRRDLAQLQNKCLSHILSNDEAERLMPAVQ